MQVYIDYYIWIMHIFWRIISIYSINSPKSGDWDWKVHHRASKMTFWTCNMSNWAVFPQKKRYQTFRNKATGTPPSPLTSCAGICRCIPLEISRKIRAFQLYQNHAYRWLPYLAKCKIKFWTAAYLQNWCPPKIMK